MVAEPMMSSCHSCLDRGVPSAGSRPALFTRTDSSRRCRILGEDSPRILASVSNLTGCIGALGEHEQTRRLGEWIWPSTERDLLAVCLVRPTPQHPAAPRLRSSTARATLTITTEVSTQLTTISHKCFLSYHHEDEVLVQQFIEEFDDRHDVFITRGIRAPEDIIDSDDTEYVMAQIRKRFLTDSTVTIVLIGKCTWARRFVDWEIQSSLRQPVDGMPNGLLGILLDKNVTVATPPDRLKMNLDSGYAKWYKYPTGKTTLAQWIETAFAGRSSLAAKIKNPRDRFKYNRNCS
jgi:hypothetical protein